MVTFMTFIYIVIFWPFSSVLLIEENDVSGIRKFFCSSLYQNLWLASLSIADHVFPLGCKEMKTQVL